jgi:hypothetical protein
MFFTQAKDQIWHPYRIALPFINSCSILENH